MKLLTDPDSFLNAHLTETDGFSYAAGDPVNLVDPSGDTAFPRNDLIILFD